MAEQAPSRAFGWLLLVLVLVVIGAVIVVSTLQRPAPPGSEIVDEQAPDDHPAGPCYECHEGMATGEEIQGKRLPEEHPAESCSQCHEGYRADPGSTQPAPRFRPPADTG